MTAVSPHDVRIRPAGAADEPFLKRVHAAERHWEFAPLLNAGDEENYHKVLAQQYNAHHEVYFNSYTVAKYGIILLCGTPIGRLYLDEREGEFRVLDIALLPHYRGRGIGSIIMHGICATAARMRLPVTLHVHCLNAAAYRFYWRLGFEPVSSNQRHTLMRWFHPSYEQFASGHFVPPDVTIRRLQHENAGSGAA
ncbi:GNAT family N-acetyltransferase [Pseudovibrio exalbescens]|uniref:GNAT family N-acetyltransferase n=1 Tax=Pseudovibrio exalbescens TaxID=197461 RepID=UPI002365268E|nr:GNAT family N-acetyltransferase [Pseudovibrio exalbescens]MDD7911572.1 GNAT family N-acetyltransferase [Pseudovibrio exalbescens]